MKSWILKGKKKKETTALWWEGENQTEYEKNGLFWVNLLIKCQKALSL